ncbi:hypothetical protein HPB50_012360 [Hyalomma asiaticum]|uniref:Uncharacterized protein n=1 Tax=Hyalomma asiaticum TaxID=266040 RepID=A0ACB7S0M0_HYAAI|nr:hypothetical protein HPB50_012360 [Hyalomma asiaticum]
MWRFLRGCRSAPSGRIYHRAPVGALGGVSALRELGSLHQRPPRPALAVLSRERGKTMRNNVAVAACQRFLRARRGRGRDRRKERKIGDTLQTRNLVYSTGYATTTVESALHSKNVVLRVTIPSGDRQVNELQPERRKTPHLKSGDEVDQASHKASWK